MTAITLPKTTNLGALISPGQDGGQLAFIAPLDGGGDEKLTFGELDARADGIGCALLARGFSPGERIAILGRNSIDYVASLLGILRAGLVAVPINFKFPVETQENILRDSGARLLLGDKENLAATGYAIPRVVFRSTEADGLGAFENPGALPLFNPAPGDLALLLYTSASTGWPKG